MIALKKSLKTITIRDIYLENNYFKISRNNIKEELIKSIRDFGIIDPPLLKIEKGKYIIIFGHNRIKITDNLGLDRIDSYVIDNINSDSYIKLAQLKNFRNEIGAFGKIRFISILREYFKLELDYLLKVGINRFNIPKEFIIDIDYLFNHIPNILKDYIDSRDINFRVIKNLVRIPYEGILTITDWIKNINMRINIFKDILDLILDIYKRDKELNQLKQIDFKRIEDKRKREEYIYDQLFKIRYPEYSYLAKKVNEIKEYYLSQGILIDFPKYFESDSFNLIFEVNRYINLAEIKKRLLSLDEKRFKKLLIML